MNLHVRKYGALCCPDFPPPDKSGRDRTYCCFILYYYLIYVLILILITSSNYHIIKSSHHQIITSSHHQIITSSNHQIRKFCGITISVAPTPYFAIGASYIVISGYSVVSLLLISFFNVPFPTPCIKTTFLK